MGRYFVAGFAVLAGVTVFPAASQAPQPVATEAARQVVAGNLSETEQARRWLAYNRPGEAHARMAAFVGSWDTTWSVWDSPRAPRRTSPGAPPPSRG